MNFLDDLRYASRSLRRSPGFLALAIATLGLGIAANSAIFSLVYQVLLRSLPVPDPNRLVLFHGENYDLPGGRSSDNSESVFSYPMYCEFRDNTHSFDGVAARTSSSLQFSAEGSAERVQTEWVTGNYFNVLQIRPAAGRLFVPADDRQGSPNPVAVLSYGFWKRHFGTRASILNREVRINDGLFTVVGVAPENFHGILSGDERDLYLPITSRPLATNGWNWLNDPGNQFLTVFGRLAAGHATSQAQAELAPVFARTMHSHATKLKFTGPRAEQALMRSRIALVPASQGLNELARQWRKPLLVLGAMVGLLLLISCANLASLLLARGVNRSREIAVRLALGAGRWRVSAMVIAESMIVAVAGAVAGLALTPLLTNGIVALLPADTFGGWLSHGLDWTSFAFCTGTMLLTGILAGLPPALQLARTDENLALGDRTSAATGAHLSPRIRQLLVVAQLALSLVLLSTAGLFSRSLINLMHHDPGFRAAHVLTFSVNAGANRYDPVRGLNLYREIQRRIAATPGVECAAWVQFTPLSGNEAMSNVTVETYKTREGEDTLSDKNAVSPGFFRTLAIPLIAGREFTDADIQGAPKVAIINQAFVKRYNLDPRKVIGLKMEQGAGGLLDLTIVGVVPDMNNLDLREPAKPMYFAPFAQILNESPRILPASFLVRTTAAEATQAAAVRRIVAELDRGLPVYKLESLQTAVDDSVSTDRLLAALMVAFGLLALTLTAIGLYGVIAYGVSRRTAEIGIRMALGATGRDVMALVLSEVGVLTIAGALAGIAAAVIASRIVRAQLFGIEGFDFLPLLIAVILLALVAVAAGAGPATRASRVQPLVALRHE